MIKQQSLHIDDHNNVGDNALWKEVSKIKTSLANYTAVQVNSSSSVRQTLCKRFDPSSLMLIPHPQQEWITSAKPNDINHKTARMKPAAPVNPTD